MDAEDAAVRAYVTAHLQPHFDNEKSLLAHLQLQSPRERPKKLAAQCAIQLGKAALYVQRFCSSGVCCTFGKHLCRCYLMDYNACNRLKSPRFLCMDAGRIYASSCSTTLCAPVT